MLIMFRSVLRCNPNSNPKLLVPRKHKILIAVILLMYRSKPSNLHACWENAVGSVYCCAWLV
jgi:hypothetical protein